LGKQKKEKDAESSYEGQVVCARLSKCCIKTAQTYTGTFQTCCHRYS
jgi:hypothetical protein